MNWLTEMGYLARKFGLLEKDPSLLNRTRTMYEFIYYILLFMFHLCFIYVSFMFHFCLFFNFIIDSYGHFDNGKDFCLDETLNGRNNDFRFSRNAGNLSL